MTGLILLAVYIAIFAVSMVIVAWATKQFFTRADFTSLKTVTFGDESAVNANRVASVISVLAIFALWVAFTNSSLPLFKAKGPFEGMVEFTYTATLPDGRSDDASVSILVYPEDIQLTVDANGVAGKIPEKLKVDLGDGFAKNDTLVIPRYGSKLISVFQNDEFKKSDGAIVTHLNGQDLKPGEQILLSEGRLALTEKGTPFFEPSSGFRMARLYLPCSRSDNESLFAAQSGGLPQFYPFGAYLGLLAACVAWFLLWCTFGNSPRLRHGADQLGAGLV
jgi:taurine transport system permease protein